MSFNFLTDALPDNAQVSVVDKLPTSSMRFFTLFKRDVTVFKAKNPHNNGKQTEDYRIRILPALTPDRDWCVRALHYRGFGGVVGDDGNEHYASDVWLTHRPPFKGRNFYITDSDGEQKQIGSSDEIRKFVGLDYDDNPIEEFLRQPNTPASIRDKIKVTERAVVMLIDRFNEEAGPQLWAMPKTMADAISKAMSDPDLGLRNLAGSVKDGSDGHDIKFTVNSTGKKPFNLQYGAPTIVPKESPLSDDSGKVNQWMEYVRANPTLSLMFFPTKAQLDDKIKSAYGADAVTSELSSGSSRLGDMGESSADAAGGDGITPPIENDFKPTGGASESGTGKAVTPPWKGPAEKLAANEDDSW